MNNNPIQELAQKGYWPAVAMTYLAEGKYSQAAQLCLLRLKDNPELVSGRIVLALAYFRAGQYEAAEKCFHHILHDDPENLVALKYLGDLKFQAGDEEIAFSYYNRIRQIAGRDIELASRLEDRPIGKTNVLTLRKGSEKNETTPGPLRQIPFVTETLGDLLLAQGHPRLALRVYQELNAESEDPRLTEKLNRAEELLKDKDK